MQAHDPCLAATPENPRFSFWLLGFPVSTRAALEKALEIGRCTYFRCGAALQSERTRGGL